jgi:Ca-activated chloride channel family protein
LILGSPPGLLALLAVPAIILLYLLKQKHTDYQISSLYLWNHALRDLEANAPWQRLKKNLLMLLQILAVVLLALILAGPVIRTGNGHSGSVLLVIDCSLSMQSGDMKPSRFEAAIRDAAETAASFQAGTEFTVIASGRTADIVLNRVNDKNRALREIKNMQVTDAADDSEGTARLVYSLLRKDPDMQVYWFGDGVNPLPQEKVKYYSYDRNGANYAVTGLTRRKLENGGEIRALSRIANYSPEEAELDVSLYADGSLLDARRVTVGAEGSESVYWDGIPESAVLLECRIDTSDMLERDNSISETVYSGETRKVLLVTERNIFLEKALALLPGLEVYKTAPEDAGELKGYDLYIFDGMMPEVLPGDGHLMIFDPPANKYFAAAGQSDYPAIRPSKHALFDGLGGETSFDAVKTALYLTPEGGDPLLETDGGTAAFEGYIGKSRAMVFGFDLHETNLPVQPFFPVLVARALEELIPGNMQELPAVYAGDPITLPLDPEAEEVSVITPDGVRIPIAPPFPAPAFDRTMKAGIYTLEQKYGSGTGQSLFCVNAPSEREFTAAGPTGVPQQSADMEKSRELPAGMDLKMPLLWLLLAILVIEWRVYTHGHTV